MSEPESHSSVEHWSNCYVGNMAYGSFDFGAYESSLNLLNSSNICKSWEWLIN
jgi:hypothetical protein